MGTTFQGTASTPDSSPLGPQLIPGRRGREGRQIPLPSLLSNLHLRVIRKPPYYRDILSPPETPSPTAPNFIQILKIRVNYIPSDLSQSPNLTKLLVNRGVERLRPVILYNLFGHKRHIFPLPNLVTRGHPISNLSRLLRYLRIRNLRDLEPV